MSDYVSPHFRWSEVYCPCGQCVMPVAAKVKAVELSKSLEVLRSLYGPVTVTSWYRCPGRNAKIGGASRSRHLSGDAADIKCPGCPDLPGWADGYFHTGGVGTYRRYPNMIHVDIRGTRARWRK